MLPIFRYAEFRELAAKRVKKWLITPPFFARVYNYSFWFLCIVLLLALHARNGLDSDEGFVLNGAWNLLNGRKLYTDFFEMVAPGSFYLIFAMWKLFGAHFWIAKLLGISAIFGAAVGIYCISRLITSQEQIIVPRWTLFLGPLVYCLMSSLWPAINHNTFNIALVIWGAYFITRSVISRSFLDATIGGLISGMSILFLQHRGLALVAGTLLVFGFFYFRGKDIAWLKNGAGFLMGAMIPIAMSLLYWPGSLLLEDLIRFPATHYLEVNRVNPVMLVIAAFALISSAWLLRHCSIRAVWFLIFLQGVLLLSVLSRPDINHVTLALFPVLSLLPFLFAMAPKIFSLSGFFLSVILTALMGQAILPSYFVLTSSPLFVDKSENFHTIQFVKENCSSSPYVYAGPFLSGLYFETGKLNPTRYSVLLTNLHTNSQFLEAKKDIETHHPQCVITNYAMVEKFNYNKNNSLDKYIAENYELAYQEGDTQVFVVHNRLMPTMPVN